MDASKIQQELFQVIKTAIPANVSIAEEIAKVLNVSVDSAYRRMRGEKTISLDELYALCAHYKISLDSILNIQTDSFSFQGKLVDSSAFRYDEYWTSVLKWVAYFNRFKEKNFYFIAKDISIFHHFHLREIAAFKYYFWMKTIFHFPEFANQRFSLDAYPDEIFELGKKSLQLYNQLSVVEFWSGEIINSTLRQIDYFKDGQMFQSKEDIIRIYEAFEKLIEHLQTQVALGYSYNYGDPEKKRIADYRLYYNEVLLGHNEMLAVLDGEKLTFLNHMAIDYIVTRDIAFNEKTYEHVKNLMKKSILISSESEKEREKFFRMLRGRITRRKESVMSQKTIN